MKPTLAAEVGNAALVLRNELPAKQRRAPHQVNAVIDEAKRLQRLQSKRRRLRAQLRTLDAEIKHSRRMLRALAGGAA